ncbi:MAG: TauD/TfdA family dioxygenase [Hahellaceae bacterium]|nr:TauD/TfdA family dioxygenase [Hahellaceae bacterium]
MQKEALNAFVNICRAPDLVYMLTLKPGDLLLVNNHTVLHGRNQFQDNDDPRHLLRLWLAVSNSRPLDPIHASWFGSSEAGGAPGRLWALTKALPNAMEALLPLLPHTLLACVLLNWLERANRPLEARWGSLGLTSLALLRSHPGPSSTLVGDARNVDVLLLTLGSSAIYSPSKGFPGTINQPARKSGFRTGRSCLWLAERHAGSGIIVGEANRFAPGKCISTRPFAAALIALFSFDATSVRPVPGSLCDLE